jgi:hypothetical protein
MDLQNTSALKSVANDYIKTYGNEVEGLAKNIDPREWAFESYRFAQNSTYPLLATTNRITKEYSDNTYAISKKRITLAGYRLANLVIDIYEKKLNNE